jgi:hypothetical protein
MEFEEMRKPDGQLGLFFCPECRWAGDTWTLSMLSLVDRKALIKATAKLEDPKLHDIAGSHARAASQEGGPAD